ncbi:hypothetical protein HRF87_21085 [Bacillus sp. CRN 9]|nr:hypothetical protein [Bacillus sp. CRN 9]
MRRIKFMMLLSIILVMSGCQNRNEVNQKYETAIEEVLVLENKKLMNNDGLKREDVGIIVYSEGKYIELIYDLNNEQIESLYEFDTDRKVYEHYPHSPEYLERIQDFLAETSYTENIGLK